MACAASVAGIVASIFLAGTGTADDPVIVGTDAPFAPYVLLDDTGAPTGFERALLDDICRRATLDCEWQLATFGELIPGVQDGRFDIVIGGIAVTEERRQVVDFARPHHDTNDDEWFIGRVDAPSPDSALTGVQSGTVHETHLRKTGRQFIAFATEAEMFDALRDRRVDLLFGPFDARDGMAALADTMGYNWLYNETIVDDGVAMAVCKGNTALLGKLDRALLEMEADGTIVALKTTWGVSF